MRVNVWQGEQKKFNKLCNKASRHLDNKQYIRAIELYKKAIKIYPNL
ncbi:tetratricopeptide repeat protein [Rickettsia hoogstraalii]|nr:tetratricopeptide repeat protein [Rickettsia hoogstraalii]